MMFKHSLRILKWLAPLMVLALALSIAAGCSTPQPVVKTVDHVVAAAGRPAELYAVFTGTLGLPQAWPFVSYPGFSTGGVFMGNTNLETLAMPSDGASATAVSTAWFGIVLEPYPLVKSVPLMSARGGSPSAPQVQYREIAGKQVKYWTNVTLKNLCAGDYVVYLCEYTALAKQHLTDATASFKPPLGGVGLQSVREMVITARDPKATKQQWQKVLAPLGTTTDGALQIGTGPAIHIIQGTKDSISSMVWQVASLTKAKSFLQEKGMLGPSTASSVKLDPAKVEGLDITLVQ